MASKAVALTGVRTLAVRTDVSLAEDVEELAQRTIAEFGSVNVVCNNAGVTTREDPWTGSLDAWTWVIGINLMGVVHGVRAFLPHLVAAGQGHIVNTASVAGLIPGFNPAYSASKHGVVAISEELHHGLNSTGIPIGVTALCPSWVQTSILDAERNRPDGRDAVTTSVGAQSVLESDVRRALAEERLRRGPPIRRLMPSRRTGSGPSPTTRCSR